MRAVRSLLSTGVAVGAAAVTTISPRAAAATETSHTHIAKAVGLTWSSSSSAALRSSSRAYVALSRRLWGMQKQDAPHDDASAASFSFLDLDNLGEEEGNSSSGPTRPHVSQNTKAEGGNGNGNGNAPPTTPPPSVQLTVVRLHNLPRNWMHEDIIEFIHAVGEHAGIPVPHTPQSGRQNEGEEGEDGSAIPKATSPYVHRLSIPFGRRTGLVYGTPRVVLTSADLARYLVGSLNFDPDDYRSRIYFTLEESEKVSGGWEEGGNANSSSITSFEEVEESVEQEQADALRTLELDRYLMAPDLLLDIAKMHQRRLVTANERVLLDSFLDEEEEATEREGGEARSGDGSGGSATAKSARLRKGKSLTKKKKRRAGDLRDAGRGSMHNTPIPKPYVQGRSL